MFVMALTAARADTFNFSYTYGSGGHTATGTLSGTQVGDSSTGYVTGVSVGSLFLDGNQITGPFFNNSYSVSLGAYNANGTAIVSFALNQNSFIFADVDVSLPANNNLWNAYFALITTDGVNEAASYPRGYGPGQYGFESPANGTWSLTHTGASVPDGGNTAALVGVIFLGVISLRRRLR